MLRDQTLALLRQGYLWAPQLRAGATAVPTRLLGRRAVVVGGADGVRRFYDPRLRRRRAFPVPVRLVLFGPRTVHGLDDADHVARKALHLDVLRPESVAALGQRAELEWTAAVSRWRGRDDVVLFDEAVHVLASAVLAWAGVPETGPRARAQRARQLAQVLDGFATPGAPFLRAVRSRVALQRWARGLIRATRAGRLAPPPGSALAAVSAARDRHGRRLAADVAGVALLNVVRHTVATAWFVAFAGRALHEHPDWRERIAGGDREALTAFAQEVRRFYPFVPVLAAKARSAQDVLGVRVPRGGLVVLDVHGTDHDPAHWTAPEHFDPERFLRDPVDPDAFVPQGGGDLATGHRCPGEDVVLTLVAGAVRTLAGLPHALPEQDLGYSLARIPTRPRSGVVLSVPAGG